MTTREKMEAKKDLAETFPDSGSVRVKQVAAYMGMNPVSVWRLARKENSGFPKPRKLSPRVTIWKAEEIREYVEKGVAA